MFNLVALVCGVLFGAGLAASGMTDTDKVQGFLDIFGQWNPSLMFVMGGALAVTLVTFRFILKMPHPLFSESFSLPTKTSIDKPLVLGAMLFGIGWGLVGYCPGPAIASLAYLHGNTLLFVVAMLVGGYLGQLCLKQ